MGLTQRPYIGTWRVDGRGLVQTTPDALVYLNGDTSIPGCSKCNNKIDIQKFLTQVSVDAGTSPGSSSASFSLSVPQHHHDEFVRDANFIIRPGLEVHIYYRGYFPVSGLYGHLAEPSISTPIETAGSAVVAPAEAVSTPVLAKRDFSDLDSLDLSRVDPEFIKKWDERGLDISRYKEGSPEWRRAVLLAGCLEAQESYWKQKDPGAHIEVTSHHRGNTPNHDTGGAADAVVILSDGTKVPELQQWGGNRLLMGSGAIPNGGTGFYLWVNPSDPNQGIKGARADQAMRGEKAWNAPGGNSSVHYDIRGYTRGYPGKGRNRTWMDIEGPGFQIEDTQDCLAYLRHSGLADVANYYLHKGYQTDPYLPDPNGAPNLYQALGLETQPLASAFVAEPVAEGSPVQTVTLGPSMLQQYGLDGQGIEDVIAYPYYHVFHGVITEVGHSHATGVTSISCSCSSMLHFWQYTNMSTNSSLFGARAANTKLKMSLVGHNFTGMHPYQIMYTLHYDTAGAAGGVGWALSQKNNQTAVSEVGRDSLYSLQLKYWEKRFQGSVNKLRLHGANGELYSAAQAAWLGRTSSTVLTSLLRSRYQSPKSPAGADKQYMNQALSVGLGRDLSKSLVSQANTSGKTNEASEINMVEMHAYVSNIGQWGQINLFESTSETKMNVAEQVCQITGFEFYQDVDGDFVFKPPFYNLDTSGSRVYCIEDIDLININFSEKEPEATYIVAKGSQFHNLQGHGVDNQWGVQGTFIDYKLVAKYGWRPQSFEASHYTDPKSLFFAGVNRLDVLNIGVNTATVTIPIRPEMRPGYPVYIRYLDCFYYCSSLSHTLSFGSESTTTLQLTARRSKFYAPGRPSVQGIDSITLNDPSFPERPLEVLDDRGVPTRAGFPNVVMTLDPNAINPLFFIVGLDVENLTDPRTLKYILKIGVDAHILQFSGDSTTQEGQYTWVKANGDRIAFFYGTGTEGFNIAEAAVGYQKSVEAQIVAKQKAVDSIDAKRMELNLEQQALNSLAATPEMDFELSKRRRSIEDKKRALDQEYQNAVKREIKGLDPSEDILQLVELIRVVGEKYRLDRNAEGSRFGDMNSTVNLLDMLSDKKAVFSNGTQSGSYRYYSASHPDPQHQGQTEYKYTQNGVEALGAAQIDPERKVVVQGFKTTTAPFPGAIVPECTLTDITPTSGIRILTANPKNNGREVVATSEIHELSFTAQKVSKDTLASKKVTTSKVRTQAPTAANALATKRFNGLTLAATDGLASFKPLWDSVALDLQPGIDDSLKLARDRGKNITLKAPVFPTSVKILNQTLSTQSLESIRRGTRSISDVVGLTGAALANNFLHQFYATRDRATKAIGNKELALEILEPFAAQMNTIAGVSVSPVGSAIQQTLTVQSNETFAPVIPVSDAKGYTVIGNQRYGRGLDIDAKGVFAQIAAQDIFSVLDKNTLDLVLRKFILREDVGMTAKNVNGQVLQAMREGGITDTQLLRYDGLVTKNKETNTLELNCANWFATSKEGVLKTPINNAATSLGDLKPTDEFCQCGHTDSLVLLQSAANSEFVELSDITDALQTQANEDSIPWMLRQQALVGESLGVRKTQSVESAWRALTNVNPPSFSDFEREDK